MWGRRRCVLHNVGGTIGDISVIPPPDKREESIANMIKNGSIKLLICDENTNEEFALESYGYVQKGEIVEILLKTNRLLARV